MIPPAADVQADVYKAGALAGHLWRCGETVTFAYHVAYAGPPVATTLPIGTAVQRDRFQIPEFFAGLLPEGETRRRTLTRALRVADDDELGLLARIGADTIGDVQVVPHDERLLEDVVDGGIDLSEVSFAALWAVPVRLQDRSATPGVQPKISAHSRSLIGGPTGRLILKFSPDPGWHGVLENEQLFVQAARTVGLPAAELAIATDRDGVRALAVRRFDRSVGADGRLVRHAQEDASQVLGVRPAQKYDLDARTVIQALAAHCTAPPVATRDLIHQMLYSYAVGNNDLHAKNLSIGLNPANGVWAVTPVYDVLHTWPYEGDHRFHPAVRDRPHDAVPRRHWLALADAVGLQRRVIETLCDRVAGAVAALSAELDEEDLGMPPNLVRDTRRRLRRRARDLAA